MTATERYNRCVEAWFLICAVERGLADAEAYVADLAPTAP